ncbi:hypothetical protein FTUN_8801 [Frigoriglobus tundricola]|uniref:Uncharacterized protein n=2 Tax=Frigoriglobus tundricola TaxID=2774151 RepID=A0A6M5Z6E9_9BACT|nr:hypothetical protein FTUN_8801 [Frigoriglobus tundricola]
MASIISTRLNALIAAVTKFPLLILTDEQIGAYLLGLVPNHGDQLPREERAEARLKANGILKEFVKRGDLVRLGIGVPYRHGLFSVQSDIVVRSHTDRSSNPLVRFFGNAFYQTHPFSFVSSTHIYSDRCGQPPAGDASSGSFFDPTFQPTWAYANPLVRSFASDRYAAADDGLLVTPFFALRKQHEKDWAHVLTRCEGEPQERERLERAWVLETEFMLEYGAAGDELIRLLRYAELCPNVAAALDVWVPVFSSGHCGRGLAPYHGLPARCRVTQSFVAHAEMERRLLDHALRYKGVTVIATKSAGAYVQSPEDVREPPIERGLPKESRT